jgi:ABC-type multidrug transport system ATPase subunit
MLEMLKDKFKQNSEKLLLISSHILHELEGLIDSVLVLSKGSIVYYGDYLNFTNRSTFLDAFKDAIDGDRKI